MFTVLFVCTGNTCRSPMAERLLVQMAEREGLADDIRVMSAGVSASFGMPISPGAAQALQKRGVSGYESHRSRPVAPEDVRAADLILTMATSHKKALLRRFPDAANKVYTLREYVSLAGRLGDGTNEWRRADAEDRCEEGHGGDESWDIEDPFGAPEREYDAVAEQIESALPVLLASIRSRAGG